MDNAVSRIAILIILLVGLIGLGFYIKKHNHTYKIGLVYVPSRAFHEQVGGAFKEITQQEKEFEVKEFIISSASDTLLVSSVCETALDSNADVLVCIGIITSQILVNLSRKRERLKPIIFLGVTDPVLLGLVNSLDFPGANSTGLFSNPSMQSVDFGLLLHLVKPSAKSVLLVYGVTDFTKNEQYAADIQKKLRGYGINVVPFGIDNVSQTLVRVTSVISSYDTIAYLEGDPVAVYASGMGKIASQHGITMISSSPDGVSSSAVAYSTDQYDLGRRAFRLVKRVLINKDLPASIPVELVDGNRSLIINKQLCSEQDLKDIDINSILNAINIKPEFEPVRGHVVVR